MRNQINWNVQKYYIAQYLCCIFYKKRKKKLTWKILELNIVEFSKKKKNIHVSDKLYKNVYIIFLVTLKLKYIAELDR